MKTKIYAAIAATGVLLLSGCASQMVSDLNKDFDNPTRLASDDRTNISPGPYMVPLPSAAHAPAAYPNPYAAYIGPGLR